MTTYRLADLSETSTAEQVGEDGRDGYCVVCWGEYRLKVIAKSPEQAVAHRAKTHPWLAPVLRALGVEVTT